MSIDMPDLTAEEPKANKQRTGLHTNLNRRLLGEVLIKSMVHSRCLARKFMVRSRASAAAAAS